MKFFCFVLVFSYSIISGFAQVEENSIDSNLEARDSITQSYSERRNIVKLSLTSLALRNFQFQYERSINRTFSLALGYSFIPEGAFPLEKQILKIIDDPEGSDIIQNAEFKYSAITPEVRIYLGKGYGKGFYLAPFYRHSKFSVKNVEFSYDTDEGGEKQVAASGSLKANTFGLVLGAQFNLGQRLVLDWYILGPHYGTSNGNFAGVSNETLSDIEQQSLRDELEDIDLPISDLSYDVNENGAKIKIDGPWGGIRAGLSIGYRF
ncbi:hypothetical protein SAMN03097699_3002 [Flavobacteriaceae bacterium MAR_2010_188]|nr:hypothetical protein SAMN03097699_3002 [Flavobacteriaceae bacterium MAR_2010_188]